MRLLWSCEKIVKVDQNDNFGHLAINLTLLREQDWLIYQPSSRPIFLCDPVVLELICYRTRANRLINDSKTIRELRKIWTGWTTRATCSYFFQPFSHIACIQQLICYCLIPDRLEYIWIAEKYGLVSMAYLLNKYANLTWLLLTIYRYPFIFFLLSSRIATYFILYDTKSTAVREHYEGRVEKNLDGQVYRCAYQLVYFV